MDLCDAQKKTVKNIAGYMKSEMRHGAPIQFTDSTSIYQYHNENIPVVEIKATCFQFAASGKTNKNWLKVNEIESLKTERSPGKVLEFRFHVSVRTLHEIRVKGTGSWRLLEEYVKDNYYARFHTHSYHCCS